MERAASIASVVINIIHTAYPNLRQPKHRGSLAPQPLSVMPRPRLLDFLRESTAAFTQNDVDTCKRWPPDSLFVTGPQTQSARPESQCTNPSRCECRWNAIYDATTPDESSGTALCHLQSLTSGNVCRFPAPSQPQSPNPGQDLRSLPQHCHRGACATPTAPPPKGIWGEDTRLDMGFYAKPGRYLISERARTAWDRAARTAHIPIPLDPKCNEAMMMARFHEGSYESYQMLLEWWLETRWGMLGDVQRRWSANPFLARPRLSAIEAVDHLARSSGLVPKASLYGIAALKTHPTASYRGDIDVGVAELSLAVERHEVCERVDHAMGPHSCHLGGICSSFLGIDEDDSVYDDNNGEDGADGDDIDDENGTDDESVDGDHDDSTCLVGIYFDFPGEFEDDDDDNTCLGGIYSGFLAEDEDANDDDDYNDATICVSQFKSTEKLS